MTKQNKFIFIIFAFASFFLGKSRITKGLSDFYLYKMDSVKQANGIALSANVDTAIDGVALHCSYQYTANGLRFKRFEIIPVYNNSNILKGRDTLIVRYNVKRPWYGTINTDFNLKVGFVIALILIIWFGFSVILLVRAIVSHFNRNRGLF